MKIQYARPEHLHDRVPNGECEESGCLRVIEVDEFGVAEALAQRFHDTYERLAPSFGYETRPDTKRFDPVSPNGRLMIAVCREILNPLR